MQTIAEHEGVHSAARFSGLLAASATTNPNRLPGSEADFIRRHLPAMVDVPRLQDCRLTRRELNCLHLIAGGKSNAEIAKALGLGLPTVATHINRARIKLGAKTRAQAVAHYILACLL